MRTVDRAFANDASETKEFEHLGQDELGDPEKYTRCPRNWDRAHHRSTHRTVSSAGVLT